MTHEITDSEKCNDATLSFPFFIPMSSELIFIRSDVLIIILTITIIFVVLCAKNVFLYIVIKRSCWTVTYSFESGLNFIYVGTVNGGWGYVLLKLDCFFFFFTLNPSQIEIN